MKKLYLFTLAATMALFSACSSSEDVVEEAPQVSTEETVSPFGADGVGYINVSINLPTAPASRAGTENDQFEDGDPDEYKVKNATLVLLTEVSATSHNVHSTVELPLTMNMEGSTEDNVTSKSTVVAVKTSAGSGTPKYAIVLINPSASGITAPTAGASYETWAETAKTISASNLASTTDGFFMTNVVQSSKSGATAEITDISTLVNIEGKIKPTPAEAEAVAAEFYVERAVAKVELKNFTGSGTATNNLALKTVGGADILGLKCVIKEWKLGNINGSLYPVRQFGNTSYSANTWLGYDDDASGSYNKVRFVGTTANPYRTYWCVDPNYIDNTGLSTPTSWNDKAYDYCLENTFDVAYQKVQNTTCVIVGVQITNSDDTEHPFYLIGGNKTTLYDNTDAEDYIKNYVLTKYADEIKTHFSSTPGTKTYAVTTLTMPSPAVAGLQTPTSIQITCTADGTPGTPVELCGASGILTSKTLDVIAGEMQVLFYEGGMTYYYVPIQHFGQSLTPWSTSDAESGNSYPALNAAKYWLGRYGVVRNNWYELTLSAVKQLGDATVPTLSDITNYDDDVQNYIAVKINILSWAMRHQSVDLQ